MASDFKTKHIIEFLLKEAKESLDHERLKKDLAAWANSKGFVRIVPGFSDGTIPDVLRTDNAKHVFVGDAKNADNETQDNPATLQRLQNYFEQFAACLRQGYKGGFFAIATNSESEAKKWIPALNFLAKAAGLTAGTLKRPPSFRVVRLVGKKTWIIYW
jgi:hypothetical protein